MQDLLLEADLKLYIVKKIKERLVKMLKEYRDKMQSTTTPTVAALPNFSEPSEISQVPLPPRPWVSSTMTTRGARTSTKISKTESKFHLTQKNISRRTIGGIFFRREVRLSALLRRISL